MAIAILSTGRLPRFLGTDHPDEEALFAEDDRLAEAFARHGVAARRVSWRDREVDWTAFDLVLVRSTWDYIDDLDEFLGVLAHIEASGTQLVNSRSTIAWNATKRYLESLQSIGVPVVPTAFLEPGENLDDALAGLLGGQDGWVLKPIVGVGAYGTERFSSRSELADRLAKHPIESTHIAQPFVRSIVEEGEYSFVFGGGQFLFAARKTPRPGDFRVQVMYGASTEEVDPDPADLAASKACLAALPVEPHLARIDMARMPDGTLALMEAELIEPQLYLFDVPNAADLLAASVVPLVTQRVGDER